MIVKFPPGLELVPVVDLKEYEWNPKLHPAEQVDGIAASILEFGFCNPILLQPGNLIVAGHGRLLAARLLGLEAVPVIRLEHLTPLQAKAYLLADNKLAESGWDVALVKKIVQELEAAQYDIKNTGFNEQELSQLLESIELETHPEAGKSDSGSMRQPRKMLIIGVNDFLITVNDEKETARIRSFCDHLEANPELKTDVGDRIKAKVLGVIDEVLPV
jgi:hypothetical protein